MNEIRLAALPGQRTLTSPEWHRFERVGAWLVLLGVFTTLFGLSWDVQWHSDVGPDTFWTVPHLFVYAGAAITGFAALSVVLLCTGLARETRRAGWIPVLGGRFYAPIGFVLAGFGAFGFLSFGVFDQWWHVIFGFDVTIASPPHLGLILSDILSTVGCALIFVQGKRVHAVGLSVATAFSLAFSLPFIIAVLSEFNLIVPLLGLQALLIPLGMLFVASTTRNPWMVLVMTLTLVGFRLLAELIFPSITLGYAQTLGWSLRDGAENRPELPMLIPLLVPIAGLASSLTLQLWKAQRWPVLLGVLLTGLLAAPVLYLDSNLLPINDGGGWLLIPVAIAGMVGAWVGWQLGVVTRVATDATEALETRRVVSA
ncbi:MAG: hypothetical protein HC933_14830 [Pleurocapsa sp. SU_196_0]|nr:hypothetical protein [Pleurocapsa sp. SU_196_0]